MRQLEFSKDEIARESIVLFFRAIATERLFIAFSTSGACAVGTISWYLGGSSPARIGVWLGLVAATELALTTIDQAFLRQPPSPAHYTTWAWTKTGITVGHGFAWGVGPIALREETNYVSTLAPAWAILIFAAAVVYSCASFLPCVVATILAALATPTVWLVAHGSGFDKSVAVCLGSSIPFIISVGLFAARNARATIIAQLEISLLLANAKEAQRERARFYSSASHDLRQPVHALGFYTAMLPTVTDLAERREIERGVDECAKSLNRQFDAILGVTDADQALERVQSRIVSIQNILDAIKMNMKPEAAVKNVRLRVVRSSLFVRADPDLLERVALNLASNAVRYTDRGSVLIGARRAGGMVRFCVLDTGIGIQESDRQRIFEDFYQVDNRERAQGKGFGLGLSIVRRLCNAMGWDLTFSSIKGRGSQFNVVLPGAEAPALRPNMIGGHAEPSGTTAENLVVLFVDDDPIVRDATVRILAQWNVRTEACANREQALSALARKRPDERWHALFDQRLAKGEDGLSLALQLREVADPSLRITIVSGDIDETFDENARSVGVTMMQKPIKPIRLRALLFSPPAASPDVAM